MFAERSERRREPDPAVEARPEALSLPVSYRAYAERHGVGRELPLPEPGTKLSIVIPALNESELIRHLLRSFNHQTNPNFEIVIVDNGSSDDTRDIVREFARSEATYRLHLLSQELKGVGHARKRGMDQAVVRCVGDRSIDYIAGTDADSTVPPNWVEGLYRGFETTKADFLAGEVEFFPRATFPRALTMIDTARRVTNRYGMPMVRGVNFAIRTEAYVGVDGIKQPYSLSGQPQPGEEGTLSDALLKQDKCVCAVPLAITTNPRRFLADLLSGEGKGDKLYAGGVMTEIREAQALSDRLSEIPAARLEEYGERTLKRIFRKNLTGIYKNPLYRGHFWEKAKQLVQPHEKRLEQDIDSGMDEDGLWSKYRDIYLENILNRAAAENL